MKLCRAWRERWRTRVLQNKKCILTGWHYTVCGLVKRLASDAVGEERALSGEVCRIRCIYSVTACRRVARSRSRTNSRRRDRSSARNYLHCRWRR